MVTVKMVTKNESTLWRQGGGTQDNEELYCFEGLSPQPPIIRYWEDKSKELKISGKN